MVDPLTATAKRRASAPPKSHTPSRRRSQASPPGALTGGGRVTLTRVGGGAPGWGAYVLLYTTRLRGGLGTEGIIAAARPEQLNPTWGLDRPRPYGPDRVETRPLRAWAAALAPAQGRAESTTAYDERLAVSLLRTGFTTRIVSPPGSVDLTTARWEMETDTVIALSTPKTAGAGYGGHSSIRIGRLTHLTPGAPR